jgi:hypothetical protein
MTRDTSKNGADFDVSRVVGKYYITYLRSKNENLSRNSRNENLVKCYIIHNHAYREKNGNNSRTNDPIA